MHVHAHHVALRAPKKLVYHDFCQSVTSSSSTRLDEGFTSPPFCDCLYVLYRNKLTRVTLMQSQRCPFNLYIAMDYYGCTPTSYGFLGLVQLAVCSNSPIEQSQPLFGVTPAGSDRGRWARSQAFLVKSGTQLWNHQNYPRGNLNSSPGVLALDPSS